MVFGEGLGMQHNSFNSYKLINNSPDKFASVGAVCGSDRYFEDHNYNGQADARIAQRVRARADGIFGQDVGQPNAGPHRQQTR